jgi:hypothetical protein
MGSWKEQTVKDVAASNAANKETGAEKALRKSQTIADMEAINSFLATHVNRRTGQYDQPFSEDEWLAMPPEHQKKQLAVVEEILKQDEQRRQARVAQYNAERNVRRT